MPSLCPDFIGGAAANSHSLTVHHVLQLVRDISDEEYRDKFSFSILLLCFPFLSPWPATIFIYNWPMMRKMSVTG